ncbi:MAG: tyrosine-protein phosphatase [Gemmataceae bacterium]
MSRRTIAVTLAGLAGLAVAAEAGRVLFGSNRHTVVPGKVYRCAQPSGPALAELIEARQIKTILNLRGVSRDADWYLAESRAAHAANISQEDVTLSAYLLPPPAELRRLVEVLDHTEYPVLIHCKQGADRTGLASAIVVLLSPDGTLADARRQLWPTYGHISLGRTYAMDEFLDRYEGWLVSVSQPHTPERFRHWVDAVYVPGPARSELTWLDPVPNPVPANQPFAVRLRATNRSNEAWAFKPGTFAGIHLQYQIANDKLETVYRDRAGLLDRTVAPGESIDLTLAVPPLRAAGRYALVAELLDARGAGVPIRVQSFVKFGDEPAMAEVVVK